MAYIPNGAVGTPDSNYYFCTAQSVPVDGNDDRSENIIDLVNSAPNLRGMAASMPRLKVKITAKISVASGSSSKIYLNLITDAAESTIGAGAWTTLAVGLIRLGYNDAAGTVYEAALPAKVADSYERYLGLALQPVGSDTLYSAGAIDAWLEFD